MDLKRRILTVAGLLPVGILAVPLLVAAQAQGSASAQQVPTFTKDVAPILQRSCQNCHRPGSIAPMSLLTYEEARPWARSMKQNVSLREMPPWFIDPNIGIQKFKNDISLSDAEIATIVNWVDGGAARGDPADMPPPVQFPDANAWQNGPPDFVATMPSDIMVQAQAPDWWLNVATEGPEVTEDRWIKAVEVKPTKGFAVTHHAGVAILPPDGYEEEEAILAEHSVGKNGDIYPEGTGRLLPAGSRFNFLLHLHSIGQETPMKASVGLQFYPKGYTPKYVLRATALGGDTERPYLDIPAGEDNVRFDQFIGFAKPTVFTNFEPHMHATGKAMCLEAIYPPGTVSSDTTGIDGVRNRAGGVTTEMLSCVDRFNFGWLRTYIYADDVAPLLPAGTILHIISWHDNSAGNRLNYDPTNWKGFGNRTIDDMSHLWAGVYEITEEEYKERVEARKRKVIQTQQ